MIDIKNYTERKEKGLLSVAKIGSGFAMTQKRFDPETGEEVVPVIAGFHMNDLEKIKAELQQGIINVDILIEDINNL